jgi:hypothetical protein
VLLIVCIMSSPSDARKPSPYEGSCRRWMATIPSSLAVGGCSGEEARNQDRRR